MDLSKRFLAIIMQSAVLLLLAAVALRTLYVRIQEEHKADVLATYSDSDHGATMEEVISGLREIDQETIVIFDRNGRKLLEVTDGSNQSVDIPESIEPILASYDDLTHLHNHPVDCTLSDNDLCFPGRRGLRNSIDAMTVVSPNCVYTLTLSDKRQPWPDEMEVMEYLNRLVWTRSIEDYCLVEIIDEQYPTQVAGTEDYALTDAALEEFAKHFGMTYAVTKLE